MKNVAVVAVGGEFAGDIEIGGVVVAFKNESRRAVTEENATGMPFSSAQYLNFQPGRGMVTSVDTGTLVVPVPGMTVLMRAASAG